MRTTGQRLDAHQAAIQRTLDWWGDLLPALAALEARVNELSGPDDQLDGIRKLLAKAAKDVSP